MEMKNSVLVFAAAAAFMMVCGCAFTPTSMPVMPRDNDTYVDKDAATLKKEKKFRLAIYVSHGDYARTGNIAKASESSLTSVFADFAFFQIVDRSSAEAVQKEKFFSGEDIDQEVFKAADVIITAKLNGFNAVTESQIGQYRTYQVSGSVDFRFFSASNPTEAKLVKNITKSYSSATGTDFDAVAMQTAQECAKGFAQELGRRYAPPARVLETRGNCEAAMVSFGTNYGAIKGSKVEFFDFVDRSDVMPGKTREPRVVATGTVRLSDVGTCWVEVDNHETVQVKRGHYVRLSADQSRGIMDNLKDVSSSIK